MDRSIIWRGRRTGARYEWHIQWLRLPTLFAVQLFFISVRSLVAISGSDAHAVGVYKHQSAGYLSMVSRIKSFLLHLP